MAELVTLRFQAMGSPGRIVTDHPTIATDAVARLIDLEAKWSRFLSNSEVSGANANAGYPTVVSADTVALFQRAQYARDRTAQVFNPLLLHQLVAAGYDRPFGELGASDRQETGAGTTRLPGPGSDEPLLAFSDTGTVVVPGNTAFDPGGIGKGLAGDIVATEAIAAGADTVMVELGGDVRLAGTPPHADGWVVGIDHGTNGPASVTVAEGGVATSSTTRLRWSVRGREMHHLIDPATGLPAESDIATATVVAAELWWAEVAAKCAVILGSPAAATLWGDLEVHGCHTTLDDVA